LARQPNLVITRRYQASSDAQLNALIILMQAPTGDDIKSGAKQKGGGKIPVGKPNSMEKGLGRKSPGNP